MDTKKSQLESPRHLEAGVGNDALQAVEACINEQAEEGKELTVDGVLESLRGKLEFGDLTDISVFNMIRALEKAGKVRFIGNGRFKRVVREEKVNDSQGFYERNNVKKSDLADFAREVLHFPYMASGITNDDYDSELLRVVFDEFRKYVKQGVNYTQPNRDHWDNFPYNAILGDEQAPNQDDERIEFAEAQRPVEKKGFFSSIFRRKKPAQSVRVEQPGVETRNPADIAAWKVSRRGKSFINSLVELKGDLAPGGQDLFDQDNEKDIERAMVAQEMFDTHYFQVRNVFDRQLEAMTGYSMYEIFNLGPEGEKLYEDFGKWVLRQSYLDAGTSQGSGRLEKIMSLEAQAQKNASFLATVVSTERLQELRDRRDEWNRAYKLVGFESSKARQKLGEANPRGFFAEARGVQTARRYKEYVREVEENYNKAPQVKAEIAKQRNQIIAELASMNGLLDAESDKTSPASGFAKMLRSMIDKISSTETSTPGEVTQTERQQAEQAEKVLQAVKRLQVQRQAIGAPAYAFHEEQEPHKADVEIRRLEQRVTQLIQKEYAAALESKIATGRAKSIADFKAETLAMVERLAGVLTGPEAGRKAIIALTETLEEKTKSFAKTEPKGAKLEVFNELEKMIALLRKRARP